MHYNWYETNSNSPWKWMVGRWSFPFWDGVFSGVFAVSFRDGNHLWMNFLVISFIGLALELKMKEPRNLQHVFPFKHGLFCECLNSKWKGRSVFIKEKVTKEIMRMLLQELFLLTHINLFLWLVSNIHICVSFTGWFFYTNLLEGPIFSPGQTIQMCLARCA